MAQAIVFRGLCASTHVVTLTNSPFPRLAKLKRMAVPYRFAACNEIFRDLSFDQSCAALHEIGYTGVEIAPFTLADNAVALSQEDRRAIRQTMLRHNLRFVGLHWLLVSPKGLHATSPDANLRRQTWQFIADLMELAEDLRSPADEYSVMVFGSPQQRSATGGQTAAEATALLTEELARVAPQAEKHGVQLLLEPLSVNQTDVVNTLEEAVRIVDRIVKETGSPAVQTMFDVHNSVDETAPHASLLKRYLPHIRHIHVNERDGREPGSGDYDFASLLSTLSALHYSGWVSLEVFDFSRDGRTVASLALRHLEQALESQSVVQNL